jgi:thiol-disulfide isomerase/thioredoxin
MTMNSPASVETPIAIRLRNFVIVLVVVILSVAVFLGLGTQTDTATLTALAESAVPLEEAQTNHKPTLMEFYANWCTSCQAMAKDMVELKEEYGDRINFVMLNVDNTKWLPEMLKYRVDGIPHFVFLDAEAQTIASVIGEQPRLIMAENLGALAMGQALPHLQSRGQISDIELTAPKASNDDPRGHGG